MENRLKVFRAMRGITQESLAKEVGVSRQTVIAMERGDYDPPWSSPSGSPGTSRRASRKSSSTTTLKDSGKRGSLDSRLGMSFYN